LVRLLAVYMLMFCLAFPLVAFVWQSDHHVSDRYALPFFYALTAFLCFALSLTPKKIGVVLLAPFLAAALTGFCEAQPPTAQVDRDGWRTLWNTRGDNYTWLWLDRSNPDWPAGKSEPPAGLARMPASWQLEGYRLIWRFLDSETTADDLAAYPAWAAGWRTIVARAAGERAHCAHDHGDAAADDRRQASCRRAIATLLAADRNLAANFVEGVGWSFVSDFEERDVRQEKFPALRRLDEEAATRRAVDSSCAARFLRAASADDVRLVWAFFHGVGRSMGGRERNYLQSDENPVSRPKFAAEGFSADAQRAFDEGAAEGQADYLIANVRGFYANPRLLPVPLIAKRLAQRCIRLRTSPDRPGFYALEEVKGLSPAVDLTATDRVNCATGIAY
jgi:hypothetical protein